MVLVNHTREFLVKASHHAKHTRMKEINSLEADLMVAETLLGKLKENNTPEMQLLGYNAHIQAIKTIIREKKIRIL